MIGEPVGMLFQIGSKCGQGGVWQFVYDTNKPTFLEGDLVGLCVNGNWQIWVRYSVGESVHLYGQKVNGGFLQCKSITQYIEAGSLGS